jgi:MOSC domain-containing protein YiiM
MGHMPQVLSVNVGRPRTVDWHGRAVLTGIWKAPVAGRVAVRGINLDGDAQADLRVHGGPDKAVYAYAREDYEWWAEELDTPIELATFGENLSVRGVALDDLVIGSRAQVGTTLLQVTQPRLPCFKLGIRMGDASFVERFDAAQRFGAYFRIIEEGDVGAGDQIVMSHSRDDGITVGALGRSMHGASREFLTRVRDDPDVPVIWQDWAQRALAR